MYFSKVIKIIKLVLSAKSMTGVSIYLDIYLLGVVPLESHSRHGRHLDAPFYWRELAFTKLFNAVKGRFTYKFFQSHLELT